MGYADLELNNILSTYMKHLHPLTIQKLAGIIEFIYQSYKEIKSSVALKPVATNQNSIQLKCRSVNLPLEGV